MNVDEIKVQAEKALVELQKACQDGKISWSPLETGCAGGRAFQGVGEGWSVMVIDFDISDQGFSPGSRGHDGTATKEGLIVRLPRELSKQLFLDIEKTAGN